MESTEKVQDQIEISIKNETENEKSSFEKLVLESYKQTNSLDCYNKLILAQCEVFEYLNDVKKSKNKHILSSNLLDKLNRISMRNYIKVDLLISKIYNQFLDSYNFPYMSNDSILLINFSNVCLKNLQAISSSDYSQQYCKKILSYLTFLLTDKNVYFNEEQKEIIKELVQNLSDSHSSGTYKEFRLNFEAEILSCFKSQETESKERGVSKLYEYFFNMNSLSEQFDALLENGHALVKTLVGHKNPENVDVYYRLADFIVSFLYPINFCVDLDCDKEEKMRMNKDIISNPNVHFLHDTIPVQIREILHLKINDYSYSVAKEKLAFLNGKYFCLDSFQKNILLNSTSLFSICLNVVNALCIYDKIFKLQYACYLILKRLYFTFRKYRGELEDDLVNVLGNLLHFNRTMQANDDKFEEEFFSEFLLEKGEETIKQKLGQKLEANKIKIDGGKFKGKLEEKAVASEPLKFNDLNLRIGCPITVNIEAGSEYEKLIEVKYPNSLIYIAVSTIGHDINFHLLKYCPSIKDEENSYEGHPKFYEVFRAERVNLGASPLKIILFTQSYGLYKVIFDNKYSWFTNKTLRFRISVLKEIVEDVKDAGQEKGKVVKVQLAQL